MQNTVIIGGGLTGLACALAISGAGIDVKIIDKTDMQFHKDPKLDGRTIALSDGSIKFFEKLGICKNLKSKAGPIKEIRVTDEFSSSYLHFAAGEINAQSFGYMVNITDIFDALEQELKKRKNIRIHTLKEVESFSNTGEKVLIRCADGEEFEGSLLIAADGRGSKIRKSLGIKSLEKDYGQTAIVCNIRHEFSHECVALEHFFPCGPFAVLPMQDEHVCGIVWAEKPEDARMYIALPQKEFLKELNARMGGYLGEIKLDGEIFTYPLKLNHARSYSSKRVVIVGDAAHGIHPIAGQGVNLGFRDVKDLAQILAKYAGLGIDIGSTAVTSGYEKKRKLDNFSMVAATDNFDRLFSNDLLPVKLLRRAGLRAVDKIPPIKNFFMKHAMGT